MGSPVALAIEISNPSSGPRGPVDLGQGLCVLAGPGVALAHVGSDGKRGPSHAEALREGDRHTDDLMPAIDRLFRAHSASPSDLTSIAVSIGPGGYTSLRIAVATAKMLAHATGARVLPVPSASVAAWCLPIESAPAVVCLASKGQTVHGTLLPSSTRDDTWWDRTGRAPAAALLAPQSLAELDRDLACGRGWIAASCALGLISSEHIEALAPRTVIGDEFLPDAFRRSAERIGARIVAPIFSAQSALSLAEPGAAIDPLALAPLYPRQAEAVTQWRLRHPA